MLSAIGSSLSPNPASADTSGGGLEARLARYQKELSDCVNCDSANTREGKAKISEISDKISEIKQRLEAADATKPRSDATGVGITAPPDGNSVSGGDKANRGNSPVPTTPIGAVGSRLDVFA